MAGWGNNWVANEAQNYPARSSMNKLRIALTERIVALEEDPATYAIPPEVQPDTLVSQQWLDDFDDLLMGAHTYAGCKTPATWATGLARKFTSPDFHYNYNGSAYEYGRMGPSELWARAGIITLPQAWREYYRSAPGPTYDAGRNYGYYDGDAPVVDHNAPVAKNRGYARDDDGLHVYQCVKEFDSGVVGYTGNQRPATWAPYWTDLGTVSSYDNNQSNVVFSPQTKPALRRWIFQRSMMLNSLRWKYLGTFTGSYTAWRREGTGASSSEAVANYNASGWATVTGVSWSTYYYQCDSGVWTCRKIYSVLNTEETSPHPTLRSDIFLLGAFEIVGTTYRTPDYPYADMQKYNPSAYVELLHSRMSDYRVGGPGYVPKIFGVDEDGNWPSFGSPSPPSYPVGSKPNIWGPRPAILMDFAREGGFEYY